MVVSRELENGLLHVWFIPATYDILSSISSIDMFQQQSCCRASMPWKAKDLPWSSRCITQQGPKSYF